MENRSLSKQDKQTNEEQQEQDFELDSKQLQEKKEKERDRIITQSQNVGELTNEINKITEENDKLLDENKELNKKKDFIAENGYAHDDNINKDLTLKRAIKAHFEHTIKDIKEQLEQKQLENDAKKLEFEQSFLQGLIQSREEDKERNKELNNITGQLYQKEANQKGMDENWLRTIMEWQEMRTQEKLKEQQKEEGKKKQEIDAKNKELNNKANNIQKTKENEQKQTEKTKQGLADKIDSNVKKAYDNEQKKEQIMQRIRDLRAQRMQTQQKGDKTKEKNLDNEISHTERNQQGIEQEQPKNKLNISGVGNFNSVYQPTNSTASLQQQNVLGM